MPARSSRYAGFEGLYRVDVVDEVVAWTAGVPLSTGLLGCSDPQRTVRELLDGLELR